jgi:GxxExxY protein
MEEKKTEIQQGDREIRETEDTVTERIIGACIEVHRLLGPGLLESAYEDCLCYELNLRNVAFRRQVSLPVEYKGILLDCGYRIDLIVDETVLIELKAVDQLLPVHVAQVVTYIKLGGFRVGLLINFNVTSLRQGIRRLTPKF